MVYDFTLPEHSALKTTSFCRLLLVFELRVVCLPCNYVLDCSCFVNYDLSASAHGAALNHVVVVVMPVKKWATAHERLQTVFNGGRLETAIQKTCNKPWVWNYFFMRFHRVFGILLWGGRVWLHSTTQAGAPMRLCTHVCRGTHNTWISYWFGFSEAFYGMAFSSGEISTISGMTRLRQAPVRQ